VSLSIGYGLTLATHGYALLIWYWFDASRQGFQFTSYIPLLSEYNVYFSLGLDGISLSFLLLTTLIMYICMESCKKTDIKNAKLFIFCLLSIELFLIISFITTDILCFYVFFESVLIPMFLMIGYWGSRERRNKAGFYLFLYTLLGSLFLLFGIIFLYTWTCSTSYETLMRLKLPADIQIKYWICFFLPFAIKIPMIPFHIWLPEAHVEAPTIGSVILASLLLKLGGYGFIRFTLPMFPIANEYFGPLIYTLGIISVVYASMSTLRQIDLKRVIAYSSIAHMNVVVLGLFSYTQQGIDGAIYMMLAHGFVSSGLFFCVGILYDRYKTRLLEYYGGLAAVNPVFSFFFCFFSFANMGFPGTSNFIGEFLILVGLFEKNTFVMVFAATGVVLSAVYSIWLFNRVCFGTLKNEYIKKFVSINESEIYVLSILALFTIYFGLNSSPITDLVSLPVSELLQIASENKKQ
jgi:NADH-quinone oxidoreductase subunit M